MKIQPPTDATAGGRVTAVMLSHSDLHTIAHPFYGESKDEVSGGSLVGGWWVVASRQADAAGCATDEVDSTVHHLIACTLCAPQRGWLYDRDGEATGDIAI